MVKGNKQKKETKGDLKKQMLSSIVFVPKDRFTSSVYFDDKGLRLTVTDDYAIISTLSHQHVFNKITVAGLSQPYLYTKQFIEFAIGNDCVVKDKNGNVTRSYAKLMDVLKNKDDNTEYTIAWYIDLWLNNIFSPLYSIDNTDVAMFTIYEQYLHNIARSQVILSEHKDDMTNVQFIDNIIELEKKFLEGIDERVIIKKKSDDEMAGDEMSAMNEMLQSQINDDGK